MNYRTRMINNIWNIRRRVSLIVIFAILVGCIGICSPGSESGAEEIVFDRELPSDPTNLTDGNYKLTKDVYKPISVADDAIVNIDLNGFTVDGGILGSAITVGDDARLSLYDSAGTGKITGRSGTKHSSMLGGAGVYINDDAVFEMHGGTITDCTVESVEYAVGGAGVYVKDGGVFNMTGGFIRNCQVKAPTGQYGLGGAIYAAGTIYLSGGVIENNGSSYTRGGAVYTRKNVVFGGSCILRNNIALEGGAVYMAGDDGSVLFDMSGGRITGNTSVLPVHGGGIYVTSGGVRLSGIADISGQTTGCDDIRFAAVSQTSCSFAHLMPVKTGYKFTLHLDKEDGADVTDAYRSDTLIALPSAMGLYVVWKEVVDTEPPVKTGNATLSPSVTPTPAQTASMIPTQTPLPTISPAGTTTPGNPGITYQQLSDNEKKVADELMKRESAVSSDVAASMITEAAKYGISKDELLLTDSWIQAYTGADDPVGTVFHKLRARIVKRTGSALTLRWRAVKGADGYMVYGNTDGKGTGYKRLKSLGSGVLSCRISGLGRGKEYKYIVLAYRMVAGARMTMTVGKVVHGITKGNRIYTSVKRLKIYDKGTNALIRGATTPGIAMEVNDSIRLKSRVVLDENWKKQHIWRGVRYESVEAAVAKVGAKSGKITSVNSGITVIYIYAQNGKFRKLKMQAI